MSETASTATIILLSLCSFFGNIGAAVTAFGQAIIFLFVWQIVELAGYEGDFKYAVFIQALSLFSIQPLQLYQANVIKHAHRRILLLFVPITLISTPIGQLVSAYVPTKIVQAVAGVLVTFVALWELYCKRHWLRSFCKKEVEEKGGGGSNADAKADVENGEEGQANKTVNDDNFEDNPSANKEEHESPMEDVQSTTEDDRAEFKKEGEMSNESIVEAETSSPGTAKTKSKPEEEIRIIGCNTATWVTLFAGFASGFLGGMVAIRGPPLIFYFLHPPHPVTFTKNSQHATGIVLTFCNVLMREIFYLVNTFTDSDKLGFEKEEWRLYLSVIVCSIAGGLVGGKMFQYLKDSKDTIRGMLAILLLLCGVSLMISAFR